MLRILDRYILREVVVSLLSVSGVLLAIMLTDQVARVDEALGGLSGRQQPPIALHDHGLAAVAVLAEKPLQRKVRQFVIEWWKF